MILGSRKVWLYWAAGMAWFYLLLWPLMGIGADGTVTFADSLTVWGYVAAISAVLLALRQQHARGSFTAVTTPLARALGGAKAGMDRVPPVVWWSLALCIAAALPFGTSRYVQDVAINVLIYICLGLGLNVVIGLCGLLDLGYIAFYGVGAYTYALLSIHYALPFWLALPVAAALAALAGCIIGYPTLRMRGDYLAIVTLGFGEIVRLILNNWMALTNGPNGILGIQPPTIWWPNFEGTFGFELLQLKKLTAMYFIILGLTIVTIVAVHRLNFSRIGRAWEAIREDETAAELMGVNTFRLKLLAYAMGAVFGGLAGAFFAARMRFVSPESFSFIESAMVLAMVVLGGMGSIPGVMLGALALVALPEVFRQFELYRMLAFGGAMTVMMLFRPKGLWPAKRFGARSEEMD
ncbi:ABC transporter permease subunit [Desulfocurvus vexinensis]|uniref:ABC transporter permease subunit n=1 Tax=Desulfocurvus vexinensis TaxID=399548 RepID=UPI00048D6B75|nr:branched-chain amino acid ABC transporter permease [Desulfocurvus vexinensis]